MLFAVLLRVAQPALQFVGALAGTPAETLVETRVVNSVTLVVAPVKSPKTLSL